MEGGGAKIRISVENITSNHASAGAGDMPANEEYIKIAISDNGQVFPPSVMKRYLIHTFYYKKSWQKVRYGARSSTGNS